MSKCSNCQIDCTMDSVVSVQGEFIKCGKCTVKEQQAEIARLTAELAAMKDWEITLAKYAERANHWEQEARKISLAYQYAEATIAKREAELAALKSQSPPKLNETLTHERNCPAWHDAFGLEVDAENCTCGYKWRVYLQTEQQMHNAWRKRAEEAEIKIKAAPPIPAATAKAEQQLSAKDELIAQCEEALKVNDQDTWIHKREITTQEALAAIAKHKGK